MRFVHDTWATCNLHLSLLTQFGSNSPLHCFRILPLEPRRFEKHLIYHVSNNKQRTAPAKKMIRVGDFYGQILTVKEKAIKFAKESLGIELTWKNGAYDAMYKIRIDLFIELPKRTLLYLCTSCLLLLSLLLFPPPATTIHLPGLCFLIDIWLTHTHHPSSPALRSVN